MKIEVRYVLILDEDEAKWLRGLVQNPIYVENPEDESDMDTEMRHRFWLALKREEKKNEDQNT